MTADTDLTVRSWEHPIETGEMPESGTEFDAIIVGGGPGGAAAAGYLAKSGARVLMIEKEVWPRDKICGDAVGGKSLSHVSELGVKADLEATPHFRVTGIVFSSPKGNTVRVPLPEEDVEKMEAGYALPRAQFDSLLFKGETFEPFCLTTALEGKTLAKGAEMLGMPLELLFESEEEMVKSGHFTLVNWLVLAAIGALLPAQLSNRLTVKS